MRIISILLIAILLVAGCVTNEQNKSGSPPPSEIKRIIPSGYEENGSLVGRVVLENKNRTYVVEEGVLKITLIDKNDRIVYENSYIVTPSDFKTAEYTMGKPKAYFWEIKREEIDVDFEELKFEKVSFITRDNKTVNEKMYFFSY